MADFVAEDEYSIELTSPDWVFMQSSGVGHFTDGQLRKFGGGSNPYKLKIFDKYDEVMIRQGICVFAVNDATRSKTDPLYVHSLDELHQKIGTSEPQIDKYRLRSMLEIR